ncbi:hypothetical protein [Modestobacter altitudinis]|uniref:hypothetical protein n=1 Tax=Modestobacter altitudinis TaxID=2213158 RepID=UPI00110CA10B|nr:hypothetical protein [Modestobacter altitudinis]
MTSLTLITLAVIVIGAFVTNGYPRALAIGGATPIGAALVAGDTAVPTFYAVALGAGVGLSVRLLRRTERFERVPTAPIPGLTPLALFAGWAVVVTLIAPHVFSGIRVLAPDGTISLLRAGSITTSNIAQVVYLLLGILVMVFLARTPDVGPGLVGIATGLATLLSFWRLLSHLAGVPFPEGVFDNSPAYAFVETAPGGQQRFRGIFSEPSGLAISSLVTIAYMSSRAVRVRGARRVGVIVVAVIAAVMAALSTSATFVVASIVMAALAAGTFATRVLARSARVSALSVTVLCTAAIAAMWVLPLLTNVVASVIDDKVSSSSYDQRSGADARSYEILQETLGVGVGLGAHRPSSFFAGLLSSTGVIGTALFIAVVWTLIRRASAVDQFRPVIWAVITLLVTKVIASPDLSDPSGVMWLSFGLLAHAGLRAAAQPGSVAHGPRLGATTPPQDAPRLSG